MYNQFYQQPVRQAGFVRVRSKTEAEAYPIAPGSSVTFVDETAPFCYVKTLGPSQFDRPTIETWQLTKVEDTAQAPEKPADGFDIKAALTSLQQEIKALREQLTPREEEENE